MNLAGGCFCLNGPSRCEGRAGLGGGSGDRFGGLFAFGLEGLALMAPHTMPSPSTNRSVATCKRSSYWSDKPLSFGLVA